MLTEAGSARLTEAECALAALEHRMFAGLRNEELTSLHDLLQRAAAVTAGGAESTIPSCVADDGTC